MYGYTPQEIAAMTPQQQQMMLESDSKLHFDSWGEYCKWRDSRVNSGD